MKRIEIPLGDSSYQVTVGCGVMAAAANFKLPPAAKVALVCDSGVSESYAPLLEESFAATGNETIVTVISAGEKSKSWQQLADLCDRFAAAGISRADAVVAVGGGMVCDLAGFAAACYMRGVFHALAPTTLLAQVDASVGGKTGINIPAGKNLAGAFHQPRAVVADVAALRSLPSREFAAGMAECVKHGLLQPELLEFIEGNVARLTDGASAPEELLIDLVAANVECKARVVAADERERNGARAHLNLGHTFAHAFEKVLGYGELLHGEAVAIGLVAACRLSADIGLADAELGDRVAALLVGLGLPVWLPDCDHREVIDAMDLDKKAAAGKARFVVLLEPGKAKIEEGIAKDRIAEVLAGLVQQRS